jgi:disulfide bond formation protein DsbB
MFRWKFGEINANSPQLDKLIGLAMLVAASVVFLYYTIWTLLMVIDKLHPRNI